MFGRMLCGVAWAAVLAAVAAGCGGPVQGEEKEQKAMPGTDTSKYWENPAYQRATFGAGCFWGVEARFRALDGVMATSVGYAGGTLEHPTYQDVCTDRTGHAEVVDIVFDPAKVTYEDLLNVFWANHDPTTPNRQGPDVGTQYRSVIFFHSADQEQAARKSMDALTRAGKFREPIVTEIVPATRFWRAEDYHQQYLEKRGRSQCH